MTVQPKELAAKIAAIADEKKGKDILLLNMEGLSFMTDYFVIISAGNTTLVKAIADEIEDKLAQIVRIKKGIPKGIGYCWILEMQ